ncbi:MAG: preprotein translocase subunit YajC [Elusimicrobiota bacterium]
MNPAAQPSPIMSFVPIIAIFLIFYFLVIRPQQKQMQEQKKMLDGLSKGDRIQTSGGIHATVTAVQGQDLIIKIAEGVKITIARSCVAKLLNKPEIVANSKQ